jgi:hypothetical protein
MRTFENTFTRVRSPISSLVPTHMITTARFPAVCHIPVIFFWQIGIDELGSEFGQFWGCLLIEKRNGGFGVLFNKGNS